MTSVHLTILVFKGIPDFSHFRHTAFWIEFGNGAHPLQVHITGPLGGFGFSADPIEDPRGTAGHARDVVVGFLSQPMTPAQVVQMLTNVRIDNCDREFNCQTWIERALRTLADNGQLTEADYTRAVDGMVDAIAEAEDQEE